MTRPLELICHIGAGKTGTSSIQKTLRLSRAALDQRRAFYLGLMLEDAPVRKFDWQFPGGSDMFFTKLESESASKELYSVLSESLPKLAEQNYTRVIWSNEWMFERHDRVGPALLRLKDDFKITILCYVRRHDAWARSAYIQWGIKHKTYDGPLRDFTEWQKERSFSFAGAIKPWHQSFGSDFILRNYDAHQDVALDFLNNVLGYDIKKVFRENDSPDAVALTLWSVFNAQFDGRIPPAEFIRAARPAKILDEGWYVPPLHKLMPDEAALQAVADRCRGDAELINALLVECGESPLPTEPLSGKDYAASTWHVLCAALRFAFATQRQVENLRHRVEQLEQLLDSAAPDDAER